mmetsp:Transcript_19230/g.27722  ORF Transcript_19230/g.27722 Transcript_19230/m.27722 type:complete len:179 (+) Transcript_19230:25-561(+)|eukprot:CAMPEP_0202445032 /NCGR_PEP_ID=MMETSP1360-20130828/3919_1 /ASSEMBLY_ACC=CAM_ASM_000848 /TAXON_ID=515479 /ORGANISM="Licmophora paradoxa, Strain CCMP2313" /LENGTH=178 /DNA_ID=CAMNT_0049061157 /DNA_START=23 /DNA_END=559 /DNA_ORIENTATION=+
MKSIQQHNDEATVLDPLLAHDDVNIQKATAVPVRSDGDDDDDNNNDNNDNNNNNDNDLDKKPTILVTDAETTELASKRQIRGAMWAGGIGGFVACGVVGAVVGAWAGSHLAKNNKGQVGDFCRKSGDFASRIGRKIPRDWENSTSRYAADNDVDVDVVCGGNNSGGRAEEKEKVSTLY